MAIHRIEIKECKATKSGTPYRIFYQGEEIGKHRFPMCHGARLLIERGVDPADMMEMVGWGEAVVRMTEPVGKMAAMTIHDNDHFFGFAKYVPFSEREA